MPAWLQALIAVLSSVQAIVLAIVARKTWTGWETSTETETKVHDA